MGTTWRAALLVESGCELAEGPVWSGRRGRLLWVDILAGRVHECDPDGGRHRFTDVGRHVGCLAERAGGGLVLAARDRFEWRDDDGTLRRTLPVPDIGAGLRFNDGGCDPHGRFLAGTMAYDQTPGSGALYALDPDGTVRTLLTGIGIANGLTFAADGRTLYYVDSLARSIDAFDYDPDAGTPTHRRTLVAIPPADGLPDGLVRDAEDHLWVALNGTGRVRRYAPDGTPAGEILVPAPQVTSCAFGGPALDRLYITTARENMDAGTLADHPLSGAVFVARPGVTGVPDHTFAG